MGIKDFDISFRKLSTGAIGIKEDRDAITQAIKHVLLTRPGEKLFEFNFGGALADYTDGSVSRLDSLLIKNDIYYALNNELSDIIIVDESNIKVEVDNYNNRYVITIEYKKTEISESDSVSFVLSVK